MHYRTGTINRNADGKDVPGLGNAMIALGYEDCMTLRQDVALQTAVERDQWFASTLCRFDPDRGLPLHEVLLDQFIA